MWTKSPEIYRKFSAYAKRVWDIIKTNYMSNKNDKLLKKFVDKLSVLDLSGKVIAYDELDDNIIEDGGKSEVFKVRDLIRILAPVT